jgi:protein TonB
MGPNDTPPVAIEMARPVYPVHLRKAAIAGEVLVEFIVDRTGAVVSAKAVKSTNPDFEAAAVDALMRSRFRPARRNGVPTGVRLQVPIYFSITRG